MIYASQEGHINVVRYLTNKGVNINMQNEEGYTSLMKALYNKHVNVVKYLVGKGADLNLQNKVMVIKYHI